MPRTPRRVTILALLAGIGLLATGCASGIKDPPRDRFWRNLTKLCGHEYAGRVVADSTDSEAFRGKPLRLRVGPCDGGRVEMPVLVDGVPWVVLSLTRDEQGLMLKHDHPAGSDAPSGYGGPTKGQGVEFVQVFFADAFTTELDPQARGTVWTLEVRPDAMLSYGLRREGTPRAFRAVFDLSREAP